MNGHPDILSRGGMPIHQGLMNNPHFLPPSQQPQQPGQPGHMSILQNGQGSNPSVGLMSGQPGPSAQSYPLSMQQSNNQQRQVFNSMPPNPQLNPSGGAGPSHMPGLGTQNIPGFPPGNMVQVGRRVPSQQMNQAGGHIAGMPQNMIAGMAMNAHPGVPRVRQGMAINSPQQQQQTNMRLLQPHQPQGHQAQMAGDMTMMRLQHMQNVNGLPPHARNASAQAHLMNPQQLQSHPNAMQHSMQTNGFGGQMGPGHQSQHSPLGPSSSQHSGSSQHLMLGGMSGGMSISPPGGSRQQISPDQFGGPMIMQFGQGPPTGMQQGRMNANLGFAPSPSPSNPTGDLVQGGGNNQMNIAGHRGFMSTPAQVLAMGPEGSNFSAPEFITPTRPSSQHAAHGSYPMSGSPSTLQSSPRQPQMVAPPMQSIPRPQSQPQTVHRQSPMPQGSGRTPRLSHPPLPLSSNMMAPRNRSPQGPSHATVPTTAPPGSGASSVPVTQRQTGAPPAPAPLPSAPAASTSASASAGTGAPTVQSAADAPAPQQSPGPVATSSSSSGPRKPAQYLVGLGQGVTRILQLSGILAAAESKDMKFWENTVREYFTSKARMRFTLWKLNHTKEAKPFEIGTPVLPRFFHVTTQAGVKSMHLTIDGARERITTPTHAVVECTNAIWTFHYLNGCTVLLRGPLTADIVVQPTQGPSSAAHSYTLKFDWLQFDSVIFEKLISYDSILGERIPESPHIMPATPGQNGHVNGAENPWEEPRQIVEHAILPPETINAFGIPQATMRCLELAESCAMMSELMQYSREHDVNGIEALNAWATDYRGSSRKPYPTPLVATNAPSYDATVKAMGAGTSHVHSTATFTPGAGSSSQPAPAPSEPPKAPATDGAGPSKAKAPAPPAPQAAPTPSASTPAAGATPAAASGTPTMANANPLKRKAGPGQRGEVDSPTIVAPPEPAPAKRNSRKRGRTQGGG